LGAPGSAFLGLLPNRIGDHFPLTMSESGGSTGNDEGERAEVSHGGRGTGPPYQSGEVHFGHVGGRPGPSSAARLPSLLHCCTCPLTMSESGGSTGNDDDERKSATAAEGPARPTKRRKVN